jgi:hypothetical protein
VAYDVTALTTAVAEGRVDENAAKLLMDKSRDLEIEIAKLLTPGVGNAEGVASEQTPTQPAAVEQPTETQTADLTAEEAPVS